MFYSIIAYWFKILEAQETKYIKFAYQLMLNDIENKPSCVNWASKVKFLLSSLGFNEVRINQGVGNRNAFLQIFKQRLSDSFLQDWNSRLTESSKANFYSLFFSFEHQIYLDCVKVKKFRIAMTKQLHRID